MQAIAATQTDTSPGHPLLRTAAALVHTGASGSFLRSLSLRPSLCTLLPTRAPLLPC